MVASSTIQLSWGASASIFLITRIIFANSDGLDYDNPKTYKNYQEGMTVDQLLDERLAQDIRDILQRLGRNVASLEEVRQFRKTMIGAEQ